MYIYILYTMSIVNLVLGFVFLFFQTEQTFISEQLERIRVGIETSMIYIFTYNIYSI